MSKEISSPAFPTTGYFETDGRWMVQTEGMSLRDWFAGQSLQGMLAGCPPGEIVEEKSTAEWCYQMADAMIAERNENRFNVNSTS